MKKKFKEKPPKPETEKPNSMEKIPFVKKSNLISWAVFLFTLSVVLTSLVSVIFPALIASSNSTLNELKNLGIVVADVKPFLLGVWALPLLASNAIVFVIALLHFKKRSGPIRNLIEFVFTFEISKKVAFVAILILLASYVAVSAGELTTVEDWEDYPGLKDRLDKWSPEQITQGIEPHVKYFLHWASMKIFGYYTIIPFIASISLVILTYFFTVKLS